MFALQCPSLPLRVLGLGLAVPLNAPQLGLAFHLLLELFAQFLLDAFLFGLEERTVVLDLLLQRLVARLGALLGIGKLFDNAFVDALQLAQLLRIVLLVDLLTDPTQVFTQGLISGRNTLELFVECHHLFAVLLLVEQRHLAQLLDLGTYRSLDSSR